MTTAACLCTSLIVLSPTVTTGSLGNALCTAHPRLTAGGEAVENCAPFATVYVDVEDDDDDDHSLAFQVCSDCQSRGDRETESHQTEASSARHRPLLRAPKTSPPAPRATL